MLDYLHNEYLRWWLNRATEGLCADAKARIRREIEAHCTDAVEAHMAEGLTSKEAEDAALDGLGLPGPARKAFRRAYLTERQHERLVWLSAPWRQWYRLLGMVVWLTPTGMQWLFGNVSRSYVLAAVALACSTLLVQCVVVPRLYRQKRRRRALVWSAVNAPLTVTLVFALMMTEAPPELAYVWPFVWLFCAALSVAFISINVPIYRKLGANSRPPDCPSD